MTSEYVLQVLKDRQIPHTGCISKFLPPLRSLKRRGLVELEYDETGELCWRLSGNTAKASA